MSQALRRLSLVLSVSVLSACSAPAAAPAVAAAPAKAEAAEPAPEQLPGLSDEQLREVLEPLKEPVRQTCNGIDRASEHVEVELTIAGKSGAVTHTVVRQDGGNAPLGACVAKELARATFPTARRPSTRTVVAINF